MGSARVWDASTRASRVAGNALAAHLPAPTLAALAPDELAALVKGIVQVTLATRFGEYDDERRALLAHELQTRLLAALGGAKTPAPRAASPAAEVLLQLAARMHVSDQPADVVPVAHTHPDLGGTPRSRRIGLVIEDRLSRLGGELAQRGDVRQRLVALAVTALEDATGMPAPTNEELRALDVLQRRATKLERCLQETRFALAHVSGLERVDPGQASIYHSVQGLALDDPQHDRKHGALEHIFRANFELQKHKPGPG